MAIRLKSLKQMQTSGLVPWSRPKVLELIAEGKLPRPDILGSGSQGDLWNEEKIEAAMAKILATAPKQRDPVKLEKQRARAAHATEESAKKRAADAARTS